MRAHTPYICWCGLQRILKEWVRLRNIRLTHPSCTHKPADVLLMFLAHLVINMVGSTFFNINTGYAAHFIKSELLIGWCPALGWEVLFLLPSWISFLSGHLHGNSTRLNLFPATTTVYLSPSPQVHGRLPKMIPTQRLHPQCSFCLPETTSVSHAFTSLFPFLFGVMGRNLQMWLWKLFGLLSSSASSTSWAELLPLLLHLTHVLSQEPGAWVWILAGNSHDPFHLSLSHPALNQDEGVWSLVITAVKKIKSEFMLHDCPDIPSCCSHLRECSRENRLWYLKRKHFAHTSIVQQ